MIRDLEPHMELTAVSAEPASDPLSPLSAPPPLTLTTHSLSQKKNKNIEKTVHV